MVNFNFTFDAEVTVNQALSFEMAGAIWSHYLQDDIDLNISVSATNNLPNQTLGGAFLNTSVIDVATLEEVLAADAISSNDESAVAAIGEDGKFEGFSGDSPTEGQSVTLSQAQLKALGIEDPNTEDVDGYIVFNTLENSEVSWDYGLDRSTDAPENSVDHLSIALHEIGHILGFVSGLDIPSPSLDKTTLLDLFRYSDRSSNLNINELTPGQQAYFSIDQGRTALAPFSAGITGVDEVFEEGFQASHWGTEASDSAGTTFNTGNQQFLGFVDSLFDSAAPLIPNLFLASERDVVVSTAQQTQDIANSLVRVTLGTQLVEAENRQNLGVLDPTLAIGERSNISPLDLIAFDVLGYEILDTSEEPLDYDDFLTQSKQRVAELSGLTLEELEIGINQDRLLSPDQEGLNDQLNSSDVDSENIYERRRNRRRVTANASFWGELEGDTDLVSYTNSDQSLIQAEEYLGSVERSDLAGNASEDEITPFHLVTSNDRDVIQVSEGIKSVKSGFGSDLIILGNHQGNFLASEGEADFVTLYDWDDSDKLLLHGTPEDYTYQDQELFFRGDLVARFEGGIEFSLPTSLDDAAGDAYYILPDFVNNPDISDLFYGDFDFISNQNLWLFDITTQLTFLQIMGGLNLFDLMNGDPIQVDEYEGENILDGGQENDIIVGSDVSEKLRGRRGNDQLVGGGGNDTLFGQNGTDILNGTSSEYRGFLERDVLMGGKGTDRFILADEQGVFYDQNRFADQVIIKGFEEGKDEIQLFGQASDYQLRQVRNHTSLTYQGDRIALLRGVQITTLDSSSFMFTSES